MTYSQFVAMYNALHDAAIAQAKIIQPPAPYIERIVVHFDTDEIYVSYHDREDEWRGDVTVDLSTMPVEPELVP